MKTGAKIAKAENLPQNMQKLYAQRKIYANAKNFLFWQIILAVPITILLSTIKIFISHFYKDYKDIINFLEWFIPLYGVILFIIDTIFFSNIIKSMREKAARIQESFDCEVLGITWNTILFPEKSEDSDISEYELVDKDILSNWYNDSIKDVDSNAAKFICQMANITYDESLRKRFSTWIIITSICAFVILITTSCIADFTFRSFIMNLATPFLPIFTIASKLYIEQKDSIKALAEIKSIMKNIWIDIIDNSEEVSDVTIRQIQDKIHLHRRNSALVPDYIYKNMRKKQEKKMDFSIKEYVSEYKKSRRL